MAKLGMPEHHIAFTVGLSLITLRTQYAGAMRRAAIEANLEIGETLFALARSGKNTTATIF